MRHHTVEVRFRDLDAMGHVNSGVYFAYMEAARVNFASELFGNEPWFRVPLIVASARCEYRDAVEEPTALDVRHWVSDLGESAWDLDYAIEDAAPDEPGEERSEAEEKTLYAIGRTTQVWYDYEQETSCPVPAEARSKLEAERDEPLTFRG